MKFHAILLASILISSSLGLSNFDDVFAEPIFLAVRMLTPCCGFVSPNQQLDSVERITLAPGGSKSISLNIREVDVVLFGVSIDGGVNDDIDISIRDSTYGANDCCSGRISDFYSNRVGLEFTEDGAATRTLIFNFDNSFSNDASKNIVFTYTIEKGDIPQDTSPATAFVNDPNKLDWAIVFVTSRDECSTRNKEALRFYGTLTKDYLDKFRIDHELYVGRCIPKEQMIIAVDMLTKNGDLTIVIPDYLMSVKDRHTTGSLGHYSNWSVKTIVSQAETLKIEDGDTGWVLSHELAHFALDWKGYNQKIMGEAVHEVQKQFNICKSYDTTLTNCTILWETVQTPSKKWIAVMEPDTVIQVAESMKPKTSQTTSSGYPVSISVWPDKSTYQRGDTITITGKVNNFRANSDTTYYVMGISVGVMMSELPGGKLTLNSRGEFTTSFVADFPLFGEYRVGVSHSGAKDGSISINYIDSPMSIFLSTDKGTYLAGDTIEVKGKVQNYKKGYTTFLTMNDPSNNVLAGTDIQLDDRGKFSYSVSLDKHKHRMDSGGSYSLTLTHAGMSEKTYFSYIPPETKQSSPIIQQGDVQGKLEFSNLQIVDSFDNPIESFALGEKIKVNVSIKNLQNRPQSYEYLAEMLDNASGKTITIWSKPGELKANQAIIHWVLTSINKVGHQKIIVSLLESADNPTLLAPPLEKWVYIQGNEPVEKIESSSKQKTNCLPGRESVDGVCKVIQTNEPEKPDADLMEQFKVIIHLVNTIKDAIYTQLSSLFRI